ncbi:hypothetical protein SAMN05444359_11481 [Neolewinella agarilytica]|uniref:Uncharacterized protein n=1 Tax=Neolewinella agarilytica TaxID=478744 RepID=A0A1H9I894_9BACT|nr:hypothetical protein SAMN05444359_11481 [Neolewinella agarilytica]
MIVIRFSLSSKKLEYLTRRHNKILVLLTQRIVSTKAKVQKYLHLDKYIHYHIINQ